MTAKQKFNFMLTAIETYNTKFILHLGEDVQSDPQKMQEYKLFFQHMSNLYGVATGRNLEEDMNR